MYKYQVPILLEKNYDFSAVKSEKQKQLTEINGYDFSLVDVVQYLKKESKNFSEHTPLLEEIDKTIGMIVVDYAKSKQLPNPFGGKSEGEKATKDVVSQVEEEIQSIKDAIEYLESEAESGDEDAKGALEYLKDELLQLTK